MTARKPPRPYVDRGKPGTLRYQRGGVLPLVRDPLAVNIPRLALEAIRIYTNLETELLETHRILLRWSESEGSGLPNPNADTRETHFDPLPYEVQAKVSEIVDHSPWAKFIRKMYSSTLKSGALADELGKSRSRFFSDRRAALWFCRGRFEKEGVHG